MAVVVVACGGGTPSVSKGGDIAIGSVMSETGPIAYFGLGDLSGMQLAIKEMDDQGGIVVSNKQYRFVLHQQDFASQASQALSVTQKLIDEDKVKFLFGPDVTTGWVPAWGTIQKAGVMNFTSATPARGYLGKPGAEQLFFVLPSPEARVNALVKAAVQAIKPSTAALLIPNDAVGTVFKPLFEQALQANGVRVVYNTLVDPASKDLTAPLSAAKGTHPDVLVGGAYLDGTYLPIMTQALQLGVTKNFVPMPGVSEAIAKQVGNQVSTFVTNVSTLNLVTPTNPAAKTYADSYQKHLGKAPDANAAPGVGYHDALWMLAAAMEAAGTTSDLAKINSAMKALKSYPHASLNLAFDTTGQATYAQTVSIYQGATSTFTYPTV
jgi:ABC-type branched-subunit amino acid transport system substrate-binding protein